MGRSEWRFERKTTLWSGTSSRSERVQIRRAGRGKPVEGPCRRIIGVNSAAGVASGREDQQSSWSTMNKDTE